MYGLLAVGCFALGEAATSMAEHYMVQAVASAEMRGPLMAKATENLFISALGSAALAVLVLLGTAAVVGPNLGSIDRRAWISAALTLLVLVLSAVQYTRYAELTVVAIPWPEKRRLALADAGVKPPDAPAIFQEPISARPTLMFTPNGLLLDGTPFDPKTDPRREQRVNIEASETLPLPVLREALDALEARSFTLTVGDQPLLGVPFLLPRASTQAASFGAIWTEDGWTLYTHGERIERVGTGIMPGGLQASVAQLLESQDDPEAALEVWLGPSGTVGDLIEFRANVSALERQNGRPRLVPHVEWAPEKRTLPPSDSVQPDDPPDGFKAQVRAVLARSRPQIRYCYERELVKRPDLAGKVVMEITVAADGQVSRAVISSSTLSNPAVESCIQGRAMRMVFPPDEGEKVLRLPFDFSAQ